MDYSSCKRGVPSAAHAGPARKGGRDIKNKQIKSHPARAEKKTIGSGNTSAVRSSFDRGFAGYSNQQSQRSSSKKQKLNKTLGNTRVAKKTYQTDRDGDVIMGSLHLSDTPKLNTASSQASVVHQHIDNEYRYVDSQGDTIMAGGATSLSIKGCARRVNPFS